MTLPEQPITGHRQARSIPTLPDELFAEILLRLPTPVDLVRASAACSSFHRIVTDRSFLRRFRAAQPPPLLGFATILGFHPAQPPHPSAPLARVLADAADFSYSFIPRERSLSCCTRDIRRGRVLVEFSNLHGRVPDVLDRALLGKLQLAVCDPLSRLYVLIPAIPDELTAQHGYLFESGVLLAPTGEDEQTSFRVVCMSWSKTKLFLFAFSSITRQWGLVASACWGALGIDVPSHQFSDDDFSCLADARGCLYMMVPWSDKLIIFDTLRMEFSVINNVPSVNVQHHIVVSADGSLRMVSLSLGDEDDSIVRSHILKLNDGELSGEWQLENNILLPRQYTYAFLGVTEGFFFLGGIPRAHNSVESWVEYFSLDVKISELKKLCGMKTVPMFCVDGAYFGFPPSLSEPCL